MSTKHFSRKIIIRVAKAIRDSDANQYSKNEMAETMAEIFKEDNPLFDAEAFYYIARNGLRKKPVRNFDLDEE